MGSLTAARVARPRTRTRLSAAHTARNAFWTWFSESVAPGGVARLDDDRVVIEISDRLQQVHPDLSFELWGPDDDSVQFVVSADGIVPLFSEVLELVRCAPSMPGWHVLAFRPRRPVNARICAAGVELSGDQVWYRWEPEDDGLRLALFIENLTDDNCEMMSAASGVLLDMALGEYDAATKISSVEHYPLTRETMGPALRPLRELAQDVDRFFAGPMH